jgi:astacin
MRHVRHPLTWCFIALLGLAACDDDTGPVTVETDPEVEETDPTPPTLNPQSLDVEGYPTPGELRTGYILSPAGEPLEITYEVHEGLAIWQGDIVLGEAWEIASTPGELPFSAEGPLRGVVIDDNSKRWPNGVVPYTISDAPFPSRVTDAIQIIEDQTPGVTLVPRNGEADYVTFQDATGCSSAIGMQGGQQFINLSEDCSTGNAAHEILHALGMYHEHTRCDRDDFVTIDYDEIEAGKEGNFYKAGSGTENGDCSGAFDIGDYDPGSMMHYGQFAFAIGSNPTIIPNAGVDGSAMGQRSQVGPTDVETIDQLYGSNNEAPEAAIGPLAASYPEGTPVPFDASGSTDADDDDAILTYAWSFGDGTCSVVTPPLACSDADPMHPYVDNGSYDVTVTVSDGFDDDQAATTATITNVAPTVDAGPDATLDSGETFDFSGTFSDPGLEDDPWSWVIEWGVGPDSEGQTSDQSAAIEASRQFCVAGDYTVTLSVTDKDGGTGSDDMTLTVPYIAIDIDIMPGTDLNPVNLKKRGNLPVAILGSTDLDVTDLDPSSLTLGDESDPDTSIGQKNNGSYEAYLEDVNGDGLMDLVVMFPVEDLVDGGDLTELSTELVLRGFLADACTNVRGADVVLPKGT